MFLPVHAFAAPPVRRQPGGGDVPKSASVKPKDEVPLEIKLQKGPAVALAKQFKAKAKGAGEEIITPIVEQAATALVETVGNRR